MDGRSRQRSEADKQTEELFTTGQAVIEAIQATGYGRQTIEKKMIELEAKGTHPL
jgi:activator of 2-hydroxyglutaryl-CoA dehydratase